MVHHGKFSRQRLGSVEQLHGTDVIVAHRLLKNKVPSKEYLLVTDAVLERLPADRRDRFTPHTEEFDVGAISCGYEEIAHLWREAEALERTSVLPEEALLVSDVTVDAPIAFVDELMLKPKVIERLFFSDVVELFPGARGEELGSEFHCHHGDTFITMRVVSREPGREMTITSDKPAPMYFTTRISEADDGRTRILRSLIWDEPADPEARQTVRQAIEAVVTASEAVMKEVFRENARAIQKAAP